jgi:hypothetical protein
MPTSADTQHTPNLLEILFGFWLLNHIHPRQHHRHDQKHSTERTRKLDAEEDDEAAEAEETYDEPDAVGPGSFVAEGGDAGGAAAAGEAGEFVCLL